MPIKPKRTFVKPATAKRIKPAPGEPRDPLHWDALPEGTRATITQTLARERWKFFETSNYPSTCARCDKEIAPGNTPVFWHPAMPNTTGKSARIHAAPCGVRLASALATGTSVSPPLSPGNPTTLSALPRPPVKKKESPDAASDTKPDAKSDLKPSGPKPKFARIPDHIKFR